MTQSVIGYQICKILYKFNIAQHSVELIQCIVHPIANLHLKILQNLITNYRLKHAIEACITHMYIKLLTVTYYHCYHYTMT